MKKYIDERVREYIFAKTVIDYQNVERVEGLLLEKSLQIDLLDVNNVIIKPNGYVILDYGKEMQGSIRILTHHLDEGSSCPIRIRLGESVAETCAELGGEKNATNDHSLRDITTQLVNYSDMEFCQSGFRFVRIDNVGKTNLNIKTIVAVSCMRNLKPTGTFTCDDELVNDIFNTSAYTLMLNMQDYIWDGVKRDRLVWVGDLHPETKGIACLFGKAPVVNKSLDFAKQQYPLPNYMNTMPGYSLWYITILCDYCFETDDNQLLESNLDYIFGLTQLFDGLIEENGKLNFNLFCDWPTYETEEAEGGVDSICYLAMKNAKKALEKYNYSTVHCDNIIAKIEKKPHNVKWAKQVAALYVYSGLVKAEKMHDFLVDGGAKGLSTFMSYYIFSAIAESGDYLSALNIMKEYYGGMLSMGATTFWEDFDMEWMKNATPINMPVPEGKSDIHGENGRYCYVGFRHSLCHGWACGPIQYLMHYVAGFNALQAGGKQLLINPHLDGLNYVDATFPTCNGVVKMHAEKRGEKVYVNVDAPDGVEVILNNCEKM